MNADNVIWLVPATQCECGGTHYWPETAYPLNLNVSCENDGGQCSYMRGITQRNDKLFVLCYAPANGQQALLQITENFASTPEN